ncbi:MAG TPA: biotin--[acetyl-CoA-carboxylase] ligase [Candidatus Tumulicola sp.]|jgi:BirA family biotin operon repressor/biotin-[acetyl-CoA-carboxylase] ligase
MDSPAHAYARVSHDLAGTAFSDIAYVDQTDSTNADAASLLGDPRHAGFSIVAGHQTAGRGRKAREWIDAPGSALLVTTVLPRPIAASSLWAAPFWVGLALREALARVGVEAALRWPNDLLLDGRKVAGILCVSRVTGGEAWIACGAGVNVHRPASTLPVDPPPAFCDDATSVDSSALLGALLRAYDASLGLLDWPQRIAERWERAAGIRGSRYVVLEDGSTDAFEANAIGLSGDGGLNLEQNGIVRTVSLADARVLR